MNVQKTGVAKHDGVGNGVPTVGIVRRPNLFKDKRVVMAGAALIVLIVAGILWYVLVGRDSKKEAPQAAHNRVVQQASALDTKSQYDEEARQLQAYLDSKPPQQYVPETLARLATAYNNTKDYEQAIRVYQQLLDTKDETYHFAALHGLALTYVARNDKAAAIKYYQQAVDDYKARNQSMDQKRIASDEAIIKQLKGEQ